MRLNATPLNSVPLNSASGGRSGQVAAPISMTVSAASGQASAPISLRVTGTAQVAAPICLVVRDPGQVTRPDVRVVLAGADITARVLGQVSIEAEEDCARLADLSMRPAAGPLDPIALSGATLTIDLVESGLAYRLFTGRVDLPTVDPVTGIVALRCHDDRQNRIAALPLATLDSLIGGRYSQAIHGVIDDHYEYALARLSTLPASLDLDVYGAPRVSPWSGCPVAATITEADYLDGEITIDLPQRANLRNQVVATLQYRYARLRDRRAAIGWSAPASWSYTMQILGWPYPTAQTLESAVGGAGWTITRQVIWPAPAVVSVDIGGVPHYMDIEPGRVSSYVANLAQRHAQTITESHVLTVSAPRSIEANGVLADAISGTIESSFDGSAWESDLTAEPALYNGETDWAPDVPRTATAATLPEAGSLTGGPWCSGVATVDDCAGTAQPLTVTDTFDNACTALLDQAKTKILATHRSGRTSVTLPIMPTLDLSQSLTIDTDQIEAQGKVVRVRHVIDLDSASATTEASIALSGAGGVGIVTPTPLDPPAQPADTIPAQPWQASLPGLGTYVGGQVVYTPSLSGLLANCPESFQMYVVIDGKREYRTVDSFGYTANGLPVTGFRVVMPGVSTCNRESAAIESATDYTIDIPDDPVVLTV